MSDDEGVPRRKIKTTQSSVALTSKKKSGLSSEKKENPNAGGASGAAPLPKVRRLETVATLSAESGKKRKKKSKDASDSPTEKIQPLSPALSSKINSAAQATEEDVQDYTLPYEDDEKNVPIPKKIRRKLRTVGEASRLPKLMITVTTSDGTNKKLFATSDFLVRELLYVVLEKLEIWQGDFFTLVKIDPNSKVEYLLDADSTLEAAGVVDNAHLHLRVKYFKMPFTWLDPVAVRQFYTQLSQDIIANLFPVPVKVAIRLAALQMIITYGPFVRAKHKPGFLTKEVLAHFLPKDLINSTPTDYLETRIFFYYRQHGEMDKQVACQQYVELSRQIPAWGVRFFEGSLDGTTAIRIGLVEDGYLIPDDPKDLMKTKLYEYCQVKTECNENIVTLKLPEKRINFKTETAVAKCILNLSTAYTWILCRQKTVGYEKVSEPHAPTDIPHYIYLRRPVDREGQAKAAIASKKESLLARLKDIYTKMCETENSKPVNRFMLQIETLHEMDKIGDVLDLRRCGLTDSQLDLISNSIGELLKERDAGKAKGLKYKNDFHPTKVLVGYNQLQAGSHLSRLARFIDLKVLDATDNQIDDEGARQLSAALKSHKELEELVLEGNSIKSVGINFLLDTLTGSPNMKALNVASNKLDKESATYLAEFISNTPSLTALNIADNKFGESGACTILLALSHVKETLQTLNLTNIKMGPKGLTILKDFLNGSNHVSTLKVGYNAFTSGMAATVIEFIKHPKTELKELDLSYTQLTGSTLYHVLEALLGNKTINKLTLNGLVPDKKSIPLLGKLVATNASIQTLIMRNCDLERNGMIEISKSLESNKTLHELDLAGNRLESREALESWQLAMAANSSLKILNLAACHLDSVSIAAFAPGVQENKALERLHLDGNQIGREVGFLLDMLTGNKTLKIVTLQNTGVTIRELAEVLNKLGKQSALNTLDLSKNADFARWSQPLQELVDRYNHIAIRWR